MKTDIDESHFSLYNSKVSLPRVSEIKDSSSSKKRFHTPPKEDVRVDEYSNFPTYPNRNNECTDSLGKEQNHKKSIMANQNTDLSIENSYLEPLEVQKKIERKEDSLINQYQEFLENRYENYSAENDQLQNSFSSSSSVTISSLSTSPDGSDDDDELYENPSTSNYEPKCAHIYFNERVAKSLPDFEHIEKRRLNKPNDPETQSQQFQSTNLYETLDGKFNQNTDDKRTVPSFKKISKFITLMPRVTTESVRSRQNDHSLADISQYLPEHRLKVFVGTWNMKGTKVLPSNLENFLLPTESLYLQDVYAIGVQEGTPFRREWQMLLQETFGPSHVLFHSCNFGVLQFAIFIRRELVWFCTNIEQDTYATRVGHKIKTKNESINFVQCKISEFHKYHSSTTDFGSNQLENEDDIASVHKTIQFLLGALAVSFSIFGTSFLFITSHFTSHQGKVQERIDDYKAISQNIHLPLSSPRNGNFDVTQNFDRVFWLGDFNFRVRKSRSYVDDILNDDSKKRKDIISKLLNHDELYALFEKKKIFDGFVEAPIHFMPTYKYDVDTDVYDTSSKKRVPSWTDRILFRPVERCHCSCYNACNSIKVSDHRPVYGIFEVEVDPFKSRFTFGAGNFDRNLYVEANLRRNAPLGNQENSNVCTIL